MASAPIYSTFRSRGFAPIAGVGYALRRVGKDLGERQAPLMGVLAAAIFAGQMLNFNVADGLTQALLGDRALLEAHGLEKP